MSTLKVDTILKRTGTGTISIGQSGDTISIPSGATLNSAGTNTLEGIANTPAFHVHKNAKQTIANATQTLVTFEVEDFDSNSAFDLSTERFTPQVAGKYYLYASIRWDTDVDFDISYLNIRKNGSTIFTASHGNKYYDFTKVFGTVEANGSTDYFDVTCQHSRGSNTDTQSSEAGNYFGGYKVLGA
jgi:hypothetical protein